MEESSLETKTEISKVISKLGKNVKDYNLSMSDINLELLNLLVKNTLLNKSNLIPKEILEQCVGSIIKDKTVNRPISKFKREASVLEKIYRLKEENTIGNGLYEQISKYKIKLPSIRNIKINLSYLEYIIKIIEDCCLNLFASPLNSVTIDDAGSLFCKNNYLSFFKSIDISKGCVEISFMNEGGDLKALANAINSFSKVNTIKFTKSQFKYNDNDNEEVKFEGIDVKNFIFEDCYFESTYAIKKVFADSGLTENLDTISFYKNSRLYESEMKKMLEKFEKNNKLKIIFDY